MAGLIKGDEQLATVSETLSADKVQSLPADERFMACLMALSDQSEVKPKPPRKPSNRFADVGEVSFGRSDVRIKVGKKHAAAFQAFMQRELPELEKRFAQSVKAQRDE